MFRACSVLNSTAIISDLTTKCSGLRPGQNAPQKKINLGLAWTTLNSNSTLQSVLSSSIQSDVAQQIGVTTDVIQNGTLAQDSSRTVTVASSGHGMHALQSSSSSATTYNYAIVGATPDQTDQASAAADSATSSGTLTLASTSTAVSSCSNCSATSAPGSASTGAFAFSSYSAASPMAALAVIVAVIVNVVA